MTVPRRLLAIVLGMALAGSPWSAVAAAPGQVLVDADEVGTMPARMVADVTTNATRALEDGGLEGASVRVTFVEIDPMTVERGVRIVLVTGEATVADPQRDPRGRLLASCKACSDAELAALAIEAVLEAIELHAEALDARPPAEAAPAPVVSAPVDEPVGSTETPRRRLGTSGWAGIAALGLGSGAIVTGAVLASQGPKPFPGEARMDVLRDVRPAGFAVLGVAGALLITGVVLIVVEHRKALGRRQRSLARPWVPRTAFHVGVRSP